MEDRKDIDVEELISEFDDDKEFYEMVRNQYHAFLAISFNEEVENYCKVVIFGSEYALNAKQLYNYDPYLAVEAWANHVGDFPRWAEQFIWDDLKAFAKEFQQWLAKQDSEEAANVAVALMAGDIDLNEIIVDWLYDRLREEDLEYPA